jgi:ribosomal protein S12 methylthiotransferase
VREERRARLMALQEGISAKRLKRHVGRIVEALIDDVNADGGVARTSADAPEIDGNLFIAPPQSLSARLRYKERVKPGELVRVRVSGSDAHDLWGDLV